MTTMGYEEECAAAIAALGDLGEHVASVMRDTTEVFAEVIRREGVAFAVLFVDSGMVRFGSRDQVAALLTGIAITDVAGETPEASALRAEQCTALVEKIRAREEPAWLVVTQHAHAIIPIRPVPRAKA